MNLPKVVADLVKAQDNFDSVAFTNCFSEEAVVFDEGRTFKGKAEIQNWNAKTSKEYQIVLQPIGFEQIETKSILTTNVSGTFKGSPIVVNYQFEIRNGLIQSLAIT